MECKMYEKKPARKQFFCKLCALRGGKNTCRRSKSIALLREAIEFYRQ